MFLSVFDIFKIGVGPSSSHTMGPMTAAARFLDALRAGDARVPGAGAPARLECRLHGSLAFTGKGHATDRAVLLGLLGHRPDTLDPDEAEAALARLAVERRAAPPGLPPMALDPEGAVIFDYGPPLPGHANGMVLSAYDAEGRLHLRETYYSIGGGFVLTEAELARDAAHAPVDEDVPFPFRTAAQMLRMCRESGLSIAGLKRANEETRMSRAALDRGLDRIWEAMDACIARGLSQEGTLPGGLGVRRRAAAIRRQLEAERGANMPPPHVANDWISLYAMAVNEENAAGGRVVTAPTNGAAGVFPGVVKYYLEHCPGARRSDVREMLLTGAAIGGIIKFNASISGAEVGCQGEVRSASAMAAAALCTALGGRPEQVENAAEIALEHHLGMTCDPVRGLVQVPCIERNGLGAVKAVAAASLALRGDGAHVVPLDACIETMRQTGRDMDSRYKETSLGGLAVNLPEC
ncbi:L-serine ammonia-lyase [Oceanicella actignis]|uniref:L-serine dehydratase n=1 Tax=Oceanicella actignis TaxID=1189325 RepID=A0A1M7SBL0_9RHOB|nr:L-serine ammonia-lyase [Oceanicella actignis]SET26806.1 L-serine dehydratase [Oceanicella actignis]SHN55927.1 L-serine dehydratase [Oceanicella actignis]